MAGFKFLLKRNNRDAYLRELDLGSVANDDIVTQLVSSIGYELTVPHSEVVARLGSLLEYGDGRSDVSFIGHVLQVIANGFEHSVKARSDIFSRLVDSRGH